MSRLVHRRRFTPLLVGEHGFASDFDSDVGPGGGGEPPDPPDPPPETLPDPDVVPSAVPAYRWAEHVQIDAANDYEFGSAWSIDNAGTHTSGSAASQGIFQCTLAANGTAGRYTTQADWFADHSPLFNGFVLPLSVTDIRYFIGFTTNDLATQLANRLPAGSYFGLVFDSGVDTYWTCIASDGVTPVALATTVAPITTLRQIIRGDLHFGVDAMFYIDGVKVGELTTSLPLTGAAMRYMNGVLNLNGAVERDVGMLFQQAGSVLGGI